MKEILVEAYRTTKKASGIDPSKPGSLKPILVNDKAFDTYVKSLAESLETKKDRETFTMLAENTRVSLLENSMYQINPYESLTLPVLRVFYPKFVAKEAVTVSPMDKPECVKAFIQAAFTASNSNTLVEAPAVNTDVSTGAQIGTPIAATINVPSEAYDVLGSISVSSTDAHLQRDFVITQISDGTNTENVSIVPDVEGFFSSAVEIGDESDVISGRVDFLNGKVTIASATGLVAQVKYTVTCSLEENKINPKIRLTVEKIRLYSRDRQISADWSINMEQDMRALFDVSVQSEVVNLIGQQLALDIDREIISSLISANTTMNTASHKQTFNRSAPEGYAWGDKYWHENIIPVLNKLSNQVYTDTNIAAANTILSNPVDAAILEDINSYSYSGSGALDGDVGYNVATITGGKWRVLSSAVVPQGTMVVIYKPADEIRSVYFHSPYVPAVLHPYPLGNKPTLTILSRYANALVRHNGIGTVTIGE